MKYQQHILIVLFLIVIHPSLIIASEPLTTAKALASGKFKGWTYGSKTSQNQIDCVQFVLAVVEECMSQSLGEETRKQLLISNLTTEEQKMLPTLIQMENRKIRGIQHALVSIKRGKAVRAEHARSGDFIQYWIKSKNGEWFGHSGLLEKVYTKDGIIEATVFGSHKSSNGISTSKFKLNLIGADRKIFLVRLM
ncbi:hypothetical protein Pan153_24280 [Gimesia panareensis]|uniref:Peptidase C51 domain-containing protein n=1 Tax=Gimesia panareensis TaxID=2527978 RepID=A0A518FN44_9PLAN|nr:hypothetical protein [Gimesia panareensis]QDV17773.1 hypothetical protein Pan153_24280 [Gimesia panareensis]